MIWIVERTIRLPLSIYTIYIYFISIADVGSSVEVPVKVSFTFDCQRKFF